MRQSRGTDDLLAQSRLIPQETMFLDFAFTLDESHKDDVLVLARTSSHLMLSKAHCLVSSAPNNYPPMTSREALQALSISHG
jgi:hypothetical protein